MLMFDMLMTPTLSHDNAKPQRRNQNLHWPKFYAQECYDDDDDDDDDDNNNR